MPTGSQYSDLRPLRICSLLPGATEVVAALGLTRQLVGISHECDFPAEVKQIPVMVRPMIDQEHMNSLEIDQTVARAVAEDQPLYALDAARFCDAEPDLVITQDLCHVCAVTPSQLQQAILSLRKTPRVLALNATSLEGVFADIERIGHATHADAQAKELTAALRERLCWIRRQVEAEQRRPTVACVEWLDPLYAAGHWVPEMVEVAGGRDVLAQGSVPSERITWDRLIAAAPEILIVMPCGFSIERTERELGRLTSHPDWRRLPAVLNGRVFAVDAVSYFSRPGPRLVQGVEILAALCHPSRFNHIVPVGASPLLRGDHDADSLSASTNG
jgi:iron complex transport system substrate-binding protein